VLRRVEDGWIRAQIAEVPEAISQGRTLDDAKANVAEALELALEWRRDGASRFPSPPG
jgi:predicted RNase H-like HicB family nuclease